MLLIRKEDEKEQSIAIQLHNKRARTVPKAKLQAKEEPKQAMNETVNLTNKQKNHARDFY